jgi:hypothetical protein
MIYRNLTQCQLSNNLTLTDSVEDAFFFANNTCINFYETYGLTYESYTSITIFAGFALSFSFFVLVPFLMTLSTRR